MTGLSMIMGGAPALSGQQVYTYSVVHPYYGKIGTLTDTIDRSPEVTRIDARLRIAVELLGIVVYRQESDTTEVLRGGRLISLQSLSNKDGLRFEVHGEAQGNQFVVNATSGSFAGPATTAPSDPWVLQHIGEGTLVYPSTGKIIGAQVSGGDYETISVNGASLSARHFAVMGDNREDVWLDNLGIPVMFSTVEDSTTIKFVLESAKPAASVIKVTSMTRPALALPGNSHR
jgi:hypothetical protein